MRSPLAARAGRLVRALAIVTLLAACEGSSGQRGSAFVFVNVDGFSLTGTAFVSSVNSSTAQSSTTTVCVTLSNNRKNPTVTSPSPLDNVTIRSYRLTVNGRTFTFGTAILVPAGNFASATATNVIGNTQTFSVIIVPAGAKGGAGTSALAEFTFSGRDGRGQAVEAEGAITVLFAAGNEPTVTCSGTTPTPPTTPTTPTTPTP
jgi:hypothetical protein